MDINSATTATATQTATASSSSTADLSQTLGQKDFLKLMVAQIQNQDPFAPMENGDFIGQMAQFSSVDGINKISTSMESMTAAFSHGQSLQAATLVGRQVVAPSSAAILTDGKPAVGEINLTESVASLMVDIKNDAGDLVRSIDMGPQVQGTVPFNWDGKDNNGNQLFAGNYQVSASAVIGGEQKNFSTMMSVKVDSVSLSGSGLMKTPQLFLADGTNIGLDKIKQIH